MDKMHWEISQDGEGVTMEMYESATRRLIAWCKFPPSVGYELAQHITLNCIRCEEGGKKKDGV